MKRGVVAFLFVLALVGMLFAQGQKKKSRAGHSTATVSQEISDAAKAAAVPVDQCDQELWNHVYHKARLHVLQKCIEVTGVIHHTKKENDGDDHIQLKLERVLVPLTINYAPLTAYFQWTNITSGARNSQAC